MKRIAMGAVLALAACRADPPDPSSSDDRCGARGYQALIGANIAAVTLPADLNARIIAPGMAVTADFVETRLNIETDRAGTIIRVRCG